MKLVFTLSDNTSLYIFSRNKFEVGINGKVEVWRQPISSLIASSTIDCNYGVNRLNINNTSNIIIALGVAITTQNSISTQIAGQSIFPLNKIKI